MVEVLSFGCYSLLELVIDSAGKEIGEAENCMNFNKFTENEIGSQQRSKDTRIICDRSRELPGRMLLEFIIDMFFSFFGKSLSSYTTVKNSCSGDQRCYINIKPLQKTITIIKERKNKKLLIYYKKPKHGTG
ncbi:hypothetical protein M9H77_03647 [Catharanthus roseus]|uniref:Uncharacterized protein n=1 Tax=Catharanthus roseus TaxID=4058 RepID=A0ACC0CC03_CATRO|nr:hypothetical protein M9H77_03647 [Catharanthus roseus]